MDRHMCKQILLRETDWPNVTAAHGCVTTSSQATVPRLDGFAVVFSFPASHAGKATKGSPLQLNVRARGGPRCRLTWQRGPWTQPGRAGDLDLDRRVFLFSPSSIQDGWTAGHD